MSDRRASQYAARLGRVASKVEPEGDAGPEPPSDEYQEPQPMPAPTVADRPRPRRARRRTGQHVRITVDLDRDTHRALRRFAADTDADASEIVRLAIDRVLQDSPETVRAELED
jgi:hypothetical protein